MGYVLPVTHFQYQDYKRRIIPARQTTYYIERPYRSTLTKTNQHSLFPTAIYRNQFKVAGWRGSDQHNEAFYAELTGKGGKVNKRV